MKKSEYVSKCYDSNKAFFLHLYGCFTDNKEARGLINDKDYLNGALFGSISNIFLNIKEELVENIGNLNYVSKLFTNALEETASFIGKIEDNKYYVDGFEFKSVAYGISILRNKIAHGKYEIDFENELVVFNINDRKVRVKIDDFSLFVVSAYSKYLKYQKSKEITRDFVIYNDPKRFNRTGVVNTRGELKRVIKGFKHIIFRLSKKDGTDVSIQEKNRFERIINDYKDSKGLINLDKAIKEFDSIGLNFSYETEKLKSDDQDKLVNHMLGVMAQLGSIDYHDEIEYIGKESLKYFRKFYQGLEIINSNFYNLIIINAIKRGKSTNPEDIYKYMLSNKDNVYITKYNFLGSLIGMFNSVCSFLYDTDLKEKEGYHLNRDGLFNFSNLDLSKFQIEVLNVDAYPLDEAKSEYDRANDLLKVYLEKEKKLLECLENVNPSNSKAVLTINNNLASVQEKINKQKVNVQLAKTKYDAVNSDYMLNSDYFKNKRIIEGIRNSISHGNYELSEEEDISKTEIIFSDIFEGKLTFKCRIKLMDLYIFLEENYSKVIDFLKLKEKTNLELV